MVPAGRERSCARSVRPLRFHGPVPQPLPRGAAGSAPDRQRRGSGHARLPRQGRGSLRSRADGTNAGTHPWAWLSPRSGVVAEEGSSAPGDLGTPPEQEGRSRLISQEEKCAAVILAEQFQVLVGTPQLSLCSVRWI